MKNNLLHSVSIRCIAIAMVMSLSNFAFGQEAIYVMPAIHPQEAIVRHWYDDYYVVYSHDLSSAYFLMAIQRIPRKELFISRPPPPHASLLQRWQ